MQRKSVKREVILLIKLYRLRINAKRGLEKAHGKTKAAGIIYELQNVIKDLQNIL